MALKKKVERKVREINRPSMDSTVARVFATSASRATVNITRAPSCHSRGEFREGPVQSPPAGNKALRPPYSAISTKSSACVQTDWLNYLVGEKGYPVQNISAEVRSSTLQYTWFIDYYFC